MELLKRDPELVLDLDTLSSFSRNETETGSMNSLLLTGGADLLALFGITSSPRTGDGIFASDDNGDDLERLFMESDLGRCGGIGATRLGTGGIGMSTTFRTGEPVPLEGALRISAVLGVNTGEEFAEDIFLVLIRRPLFADSIL